MRLRKILSYLAMIAPFVVSILVVSIVSEIKAVAANDTNGMPSQEVGTDSSQRNTDNNFLSISMHSKDAFARAPSGLHTFGSIKIENTVSSNVLLVARVLLLVEAKTR